MSTVSGVFPGLVDTLWYAPAGGIPLSPVMWEMSVPTWAWGLGAALILAALAILALRSAGRFQPLSRGRRGISKLLHWPPRRRPQHV